MKAENATARYDQIPLFLTPEEVADLVGGNAAVIRRAARAGKIPADKVSGKWVICRDTIFANAYGALAAQEA
ncbi:hypothetical protein B5F74_02355 [Collinsella sp. An271]|uniref:helix-turn-helix domain-containing protein n=1 Tax=Collinsella sp. An271 TaxID=1965616 RepID=UPI000B381406|nr:helix-turn-helix domain-containing protein [Collinsella sp. An271]OUO62074.1 hypothetical protein B5F74_02355 [Collinsella sp. An271]